MGPPSGTGVRIVGGRYRLIERLGQGGMGTVWRAHDELLDRTVAVKEVDLPQLGDDVDTAQLRERTMREARAAARMAHPNAVTVYDVVEDGDRPWIVMQLLIADSLAAVIRESGPLEAGRVAEIGLAVLSALEAAHSAGILHRDVKPGNVLLGEDGRVVLTDFGIATLEGDPSLTSTGLLLGAPAYIAPERARGLTPGPASDLWSLGATLFTALEGRPPFDRGTPLATLTAMISEDPPRPSIDGPLGHVVSGLLRRDPYERMDAAGARRLLEEAREEAIRAAPEALATTLETAIPTATGGGVAVPDRTEVVERPPAAPFIGVVGVSEPRDTPTSPTKRRWIGPAALAGVSLLLVATVVASILYASASDDEGQRAGAGSGATPSAGASVRATTPSTPSPASATPSAAAAANGSVPTGYILYRDPSGFSVAVPRGWQKTRQRGDTSDGQFDFQDPQSGQFLRFGYTTSPKDDPVADWESQESRLRAREPSYRRISIEAVDYRDYAAADWDFSIGSTRVKDRGFKVDDSHGYAIYLSAPQSAFDAALKHFEVAQGTFKPAP